MTNRLWNFLEEQFSFIREANENEYLEFDTVMGKFIVEPIYGNDGCDLIDFTVYHNRYATTCRKAPDIWFWGAIDEHLFD
jgi:hypothetical protein